VCWVYREFTVDCGENSCSTLHFRTRNSKPALIVAHFCQQMRCSVVAAGPRFGREVRSEQTRPKAIGNVASATLVRAACGLTSLSRPLFRLENLLSEPMVDINLLTTVFPVVFADALDRTLTTVEVLPVVETGRELAAKAG
jgi:hypothetical protein